LDIDYSLRTRRLVVYVGIASVASLAGNVKLVNTINDMGE